jgi:transposase
MENVSIIGLDLAKNVFQAHGARGDGSTVFRRKISRTKLLSFFASVHACTVAMEACASAHYWARQIGALGHEVRLIAPIYVKPFGAPRRRVLPVEEGSTQRVVDSSGS